LANHPTPICKQYGVGIPAEEIKKMDLRSRATDTNFRVGNWYENKQNKLESGRLVRDYGNQVILSRVGKTFVVDKADLEAAKELR